MSDFPPRTDQHTRLAGARKLEILLFTLAQDPLSGRSELFAIDVLKVREVMRAAQITRAPDAPPAIAGMICLRGALVPVIDLARCAGLAPPAPGEIMIVAETGGRTQALLVQSVETILRVERTAMKAPPGMLARGTRGRIAAVTALDDGRLVMMLDLDKVLADAAGGEAMTERASPAAPGAGAPTVLFAGDCAVARQQHAPALQALER